MDFSAGVVLILAFETAARKRDSARWCPSPRGGAPPHPRPGGGWVGGQQEREAGREGGGECGPLSGGRGCSGGGGGATGGTWAPAGEALRGGRRSAGVHPRRSAGQGSSDAGAQPPREALKPELGPRYTAFDGPTLQTAAKPSPPASTSGKGPGGTAGASRLWPDPPGLLWEGAPEPAVTQSKLLGKWAGGAAQHACRHTAPP